MISQNRKSIEIPKKTTETGLYVLQKHSFLWLRVEICMYTIPRGREGVNKLFILCGQKKK